MGLPGKIWVLGGDGRQRALARLLREDGGDVTVFAQGCGTICTDGLEEADTVILPMPVSSPPGVLFAPMEAQAIPLEAVADRLRPDCFLCGGRVTGADRALFQRRGLMLPDYFAREETAVANAVPTAEGAVQLALERLPITLMGAEILVLGFGRVGQAAALRFAALGAQVTAAARKYEALALARSLGLGTERLGEPGDWGRFDLVVNTVPAPLLGGAELARLGPDCLILDLASGEGGVDFRAAEQLGLTAVHALALPGKTAPVTAARILRDSIYHMLSESERKVLIGK